MNNRFIILIGSYNNEQWVESNLGSVLSQDYPHYKVIYFDDCSKDETLKKATAKVKDDPRFSVYGSMSRQHKTWFYSKVESNVGVELQDNDILVFLDGDDMFYAENVLSYLNEIYNKSGCWMTYGGMLVWEGGDKVVEPYPQNSEFPADVIAAKAYRKDTWRSSHLKTMRGFVWKAIDKKDLLFNDKFLVGPDDLAIMFAALELCPPERVFRVKEPIYLYNHSQQNNFGRAHTDQMATFGPSVEMVVRSRNPYETISFVTPTLAGGLGNQMFEIAAAASLAKDNGAVLMVNNEEHILPNQGRNVNNYTSNIFSKIVFDKNLPVKEVHRRDLCTYEAIPFKPNLKLLGHFQSWRYFDHNREYIQKLFLPHRIETRDITAIQVRRGDYYKFPDHHPQLTPDYFAKAVKLAGCKDVAIFSDDPKWCEENLVFDSDVIIQYMGKDEDWSELYKMSGYKNLIISNSSFGWWAAYLNTRTDKKVFVPSTWFGRAMIAEGFNIDDLVLPDWIKV